MLKESYWIYAHPYLPILTPELHFFEYVRDRSALLFTAILAVGASAAVLQANHGAPSVDTAHSLHAHVEKLLLAMYATKSKSLELVQAQIVSACTCA